MNFWKENCLAEVMNFITQDVIFVFLFFFFSVHTTQSSHLDCTKKIIALSRYILQRACCTLVKTILSTCETKLRGPPQGNNVSFETSLGSDVNPAKTFLKVRQRRSMKAWFTDGSNGENVL